MVGAEAPNVQSAAHYAILARAGPLRGGVDGAILTKGCKAAQALSVLALTLAGKGGIP